MDRSSLVFAVCVALSGALGAATYKLQAAWSAEIARTEEISRAVTRIEARLTTPPCTSTPAAASAEPVLSTIVRRPSDPESLAKANTLLDDAVAHHLWGSDHAESMRRLLPSLSDEDRQAVLRRFMTAANTGQMAIRTPGQPPY